MINQILSYITYTSLIVTAMYLVVYSKLYSWWRTPMGLVMNLSLVSVGVIAFGVASRLVSHEMGSVIASIGWVAYTLLLIWRLRLLTAYAQSHSQEPQANSPINGSDNISE